jgi:hypothetical protein
MAGHSVQLDDEHYRAAETTARSLGKTPEQYVQALIEADSRSFDEILAPVRGGFEKMGDGELDELLDRARSAARRQSP